MQIADLFFVLSAAAPAPGRTRPRAKSERNRAGFLIIFFRPERGAGCLFFAPCPDRVSNGAKNENPIVKHDC